MVFARMKASLGPEKWLEHKTKMSNKVKDANAKMQRHYGRKFEPIEVEMAKLMTAVSAMTDFFDKQTHQFRKMAGKVGKEVTALRHWEKAWWRKVSYTKLLPSFLPFYLPLLFSKKLKANKFIRPKKPKRGLSAQKL